MDKEKTAELTPKQEEAHSEVVTPAEPQQNNTLTALFNTPKVNRANRR